MLLNRCSAINGTDDPWRRFQLLQLAVKCRDDRLRAAQDCTWRRSLPVLNGKYTRLGRFNIGQLSWQMFMARTQRLRQRRCSMKKSATARLYSICAAAHSIKNASNPLPFTVVAGTF